MTDKRNLCIFQTDINTKKAAGGMPEELDRQTIFSSSLRMIHFFVSVILRFVVAVFLLLERHKARNEDSKVEN